MSLLLILQKFRTWWFIMRQFFVFSGKMESYKRYFFRNLNEIGKQSPFYSPRLKRWKFALQLFNSTIKAYQLHRENMYLASFRRMNSKMFLFRKWFFVQYRWTLLDVIITGLLLSQHSGRQTTGWTLKTFSRFTLNWYTSWYG